MSVMFASQVVDGLYLGNIRGKTNMMLLCSDVRKFNTGSIAGLGQAFSTKGRRLPLQAINAFRNEGWEIG